MEAAEQERIEQERIEADRRELETLRAQYGDLLPDTLQLLYSLRKQGHYRLVDTVGRALLAEKEHARLTDLQERNAITEEVMLLGERMGYSGLTLGRLASSAGPGNFAIMGGVDCWSDFVSHASIEMLRQARDTAYYEVEGYVKSRERLRALSKEKHS
jgi:hypothetical protein